MPASKPFEAVVNSAIVLQLPFSRLHSVPFVFSLFFLTLVR
jgi:hypothetical protein